MIILGIETSCDETSASIINNGNVLSNVVHSQLDHIAYGGVIPEIASKNHEKLIYSIVDQAVKESHINLNDISAIAVTYGPGLIGSLLIGLNFAKGLSVGLDIPLIGINHLEGHLVSNFIGNSTLDYPYLCLLVSGGHTQIILVEANAYKILGETVDDAAGEAFDKGAKILKLNYPGGPEIEKISKNGDTSKYKFTVPVVKKNPYDFSFSGLKTALLYLVRDMSEEDVELNISHIAASYQEVILDTLFHKLTNVINDYNINNISIVGGVSVNKRFRLKATNFSNEKNINIFFPDIKYCTDNAAMIAMAGYIKLKNKEYSELNLTPNPRLTF